MAVQSPLRKVFRSVFSNTFNLTVNFLSRIGGGSVVTYLSRLLTSSTTTPFYSGTTNIVDSSATGDYREIQPGRCLDFNGTTQSINLIDQNINIPFVDGTYSVWFYADVASADKFIDQNTGGRIGFGTGAGVNALSMYCSIGGSTSTADAYVPLKWHHCVWVLENQTRALYVNGELLQTFAAGYPTTFTGGRIGAIYNDTGNHFDGKLFDFRFYTRALTNDEITAIYRQGLQPDSIVEGQPDATNLVGRWLLDDNSETTAYDSSGNGNHGTIVGYASEMLYEGDDVPYSAQNLVGWSPLTGFSNDVPEGLSGNSYRFDGIDDWIQVGDPVSLRPLTPTVSLWFKVNGLDHMHTMFCSPSNGTNNGFMLRVQNSDNKIKAFIDANGWKSVSSNEVVELNKWTHAAMTYDGSILKLYVNGVLQSDSASFTHSSWSVPISVSGFIGRYHNVVEFYRLMKGMVKDVRVYNTGLTQDNISFLANGSGVNPGSANLVGHWELDGDLTESSGNADLSTATAVGNNGEILSRDESTPTNDVLGNPLDYTGTVPKYATPVDAPCLTFNGSTQYIGTGLTTDLAGKRNVFRFWANATANGMFVSQDGNANLGFYIFDNGTYLQISFKGDNANTYSYLIPSIQGAMAYVELDITFPAHNSNNNTATVHSWKVNDVEQSVTETGIVRNWLRGTSEIQIGVRESNNLFFSGQLFGMSLSVDGNDVFYLPFSEGDGNTVYDVVNGNSYTITGYASTMWDNTQDQFFYSFENGCGESTHWTDFADGSYNGWVFSNATEGVHCLKEMVEFEGKTGFKITGLEYRGSCRYELQLTTFTFVDTEDYLISFDYYIPSSNTSFLRTQANPWGIAVNYTITDAWTSVEREVTTSSPTNPWRIYPFHDGVAQMEAGDIFYIANMKVVPVTTPIAVPALSDNSATVTGEPITGLPGLLNSDTYNLNLLPEPDAPYQRSAIPGATFDGVGDYVDTGVTSVPDEITIETVLKMPSSFGLRLAFGGYGSPPSKDRLYIGCNASGQVIAGCADKYQNTLISSSSFSVNEWLSIRMIVGAGVVQVFVNDVLEIDDTYTQTLPFALPRIGRVVIYYWPSSIQSVSYSGLFAYDFRENNGLIIPDRSGNGNDGMLVVNSSLAQIFAPTALETAYTLGDGRTRPHYVTIDGPNEKDFRTEII
jgi:hypothetical protein